MIELNPEKTVIDDEIVSLFHEKCHFFMKNVTFLNRFTPAFLGNGRLSESDVVLSGYQVPKGVSISSVDIYTHWLK